MLKLVDEKCPDGDIQHRVSMLLGNSTSNMVVFNDGVKNEKGMAPRKYPLSLAVLNILKLARVNGANPEIGPSV